MAAGTAELQILLEARDRATPVLASAQARVQAYARSVDTSLKPALLALASVTTAAIGLSVTFARAAMDEEAAQAKLAQAVRNTGVSFAGALPAGIMASVNALEHLSGFSKVEVMDALSLLVAQTGDYEEALRRERIATDLSRLAHVDLYTASKLLGKINDESVTALQRMGFAIRHGATEQEAFAVITKKVNGESAAFMQTAAGKLADLHNRWTDFQAKLGEKLLPIVLLVAERLSDVMDQLLQSGAVERFADGVRGVAESFSEVALRIAPLAAALGIDLFARVIAGALRLAAALAPAVVVLAAFTAGYEAAGVIAQDDAFGRIATGVDAAAVAFALILVRMSPVLSMILSVTAAGGQLVLTTQEITDRWEDWRAAAHEGLLENQGLVGLLIERLVQAGDSFDRFGRQMQGWVTALGAAFQGLGDFIEDRIIQLDQIILKLNEIAGTTVIQPIGGRTPQPQPINPGRPTTGGGGPPAPSGGDGSTGTSSGGSMCPVGTTPIYDPSGTFLGCWDSATGGLQQPASGSGARVLDVTGSAGLPLAVGRASGARPFEQGGTAGILQPNGLYSNINYWDPVNQQRPEYLAMLARQRADLIANPQVPIDPADIGAGERAGAQVVVHVSGPVYGFDDFNAKVKQAIRDAVLAGNMRGVLDR